MTPSKLSGAIIRCLDDAQNSAAGHPKLAATLCTLYEKTNDPKAFFKAFFLPFSNVLLVYKREPAAERIVSFGATFAVKTVTKEKEVVSEDSASEQEEELEECLFSLLVDKLLTLHNAKDKAVRFRVCQLVAKLLNCAAEESCVVGSRRLERIQRAMLVRLHDKIPLVRIHAVAALELLQETDPDCPVTSALLNLLAKDTSPDVRKCILNKITCTDRSMAAVIERTRDAKDVIRHNAFLWLADKCSIRNFTIGKRIQLLRDGLNDLSKVVVKGCVHGLLRSWSLECDDGNFISLLARLDVESFPEVAELAMVRMFEDLPMNSLVDSMAELLAMTGDAPPEGTPKQTTPTTRGSITPLKTTPTAAQQMRPAQSPAPPASSSSSSSSSKLLSRNLMGCEEVFYWGCLCRYLHKKGREGEEGLEKILPTLSEFCVYIESYVEEVLLLQEDLEGKLQSQFVTQQLCSMLAAHDLSDEVGRCRLSKMVCDLLIKPGFPLALIGPILELQTKLWPQDMHRVEKLAEAIAELRQPSTLDGRGSSAPLEESYLSSSLSFVDLQDDPDTLLKCLAITCELLKGLKRRKLDNPIVLTLADSLLFPCIQNENPFVRDMALHCLGLASLLDLSTARNHILLFLQVSQVDHESVQATALKVVFDLLHVYGFNAFVTTGGSDQEEGEAAADFTQIEGLSMEPEEEGEGEGEEDGEGGDQTDCITQRLLNIMAGFLEGESMLLREVAGEGICKLLLSQRILSQKLLAKLLVLWYNPISQEEASLRSVLGLFFPTFAALDRSCRLSLSEVYLPVMRMVSEAPPSSPLASISTNNLSDFVVHLTRPIDPNEESVHDSLAISICNELLSDPLSSEVRVYCRTLSSLDLTPSNASNAADLLTLWEKMKCEITDKTSLRYLNKFGETVKKLGPKVTGVVSDAAAAPHVPEDTATPPPVNHKIPEEGVDPLPTGGNKAALVNGQSVRATGRRGGRKKRITFTREPSSTEEESESENIEPEDIAALPKRSPSTAVRSAKKSAMALVANGCVDGGGTPVSNSLTGTVYCGSSDDDADSDDSIVGEHSPFVKPVGRKRKHFKPLRPIQYSDDEEEGEGEGTSVR